ncbi:MAG: hypothetical protein ACYDB7_11995, partial [Mycobacteriales bacterium]
DRVDPGLYGGCVAVNCSLEELVWLPVQVVAAPPGETLTCLPPPVPVPPGYHPKQVPAYVTISLAGGNEIDCGPLPGWVSRLVDLAPPAAGAPASSTS